MNNLLEKDFENIEKDAEIEILFDKNGLKNEVIVILGRVIDNDKKLRKLHIVEVSGDDTIIRYEQIKSVKIFNL